MTSIINTPKVQNRSTKNDPVLSNLPLACSDEKAAVEFIEKMRWADKAFCPCCGSISVYQMRDNKTGKRQANWRWRCNDCKQQFTARKGTIMEDSRIEFRHWCFAFWRASTSKKGVSALEIHRQTGLSYKSSLFLLNRIRFAMAVSAPAQLSGDVEVDETYIGGKPRHKGNNKRGRGTKKQAVLAMVERNGNVKAYPVANVTGKTLKQAILDNVDTSARLISDENPAYKGIGDEYEGGHHTVTHSRGEYVRGDIYSNTIESFFGLVKRSINGIYHAVSKEHLPRYIAECEFRWNHRKLGDGERVQALILATEGKRLMYRESANA